MCECECARALCVVNLQSVRQTGQLSFKMKTEQVGNSLPDSKGFPSGTCEANYVIGDINIWLLCTKEIIIWSYLIQLANNDYDICAMGN